MLPLKKDITFGDGIIPDISVRQTQKDFIDNRDVVLEYTLQLITQKSHVMQKEIKR